MVPSGNDNRQIAGSSDVRFLENSSHRGSRPLLAGVSDQGKTRQGYLVERAMMPIHHRRK
jgi:hypothetical protein